MKNRMRKITITLEESLAQWMRTEAARKDTTVSRLVAGILQEQLTGEEHYKRAMREALARKSFLESDSPYLGRDEIHDRNQDH
jgi:hypothetical protein